MLFNPFCTFTTAQLLALKATVVLLLFMRPALGLRVFWGLLVPVLPAVLLVRPLCGESRSTSTGPRAGEDTGASTAER